MPFSTEDKIFATGIFFGAMEKLKPFSRAVISPGLKVRCDTLTTHFSFFSFLFFFLFLFFFFFFEEHADARATVWIQVQLTNHEAL